MIALLNLFYQTTSQSNQKEFEKLKKAPSFLEVQRMRNIALSKNVEISVGLRLV